MKIIISVFSINSDMYNIHEVNEKGANYIFHKYFFDKLEFKKHVLLYTKEYEVNAKKFKSMINEKFNHDVELKNFTMFSDEIIKTPDFLRKELDYIFSSYSKYNIYFLINPGFGLIKYVIRDFEIKYKITTIYLNYDPKKSDLPELLKLCESISEAEEKIGKFDLLEETEAYSKIYEKARRIASEDINVLIYGETGTGKEIIADYIQSMSKRNDKRYEKVNCSAFREILESRLFGHVKGSFTGAIKDQKGILEIADGGTVFLDEIGDIDPVMQQMLLRFLQFQEIQPIGGTSKKVNVRVISATNKDLLKLINEGKFRNDLFYRLGIIIKLPPLRSLSISDKNKLFISMMMRVKAKLNKNYDIIISDDLKEFLLNYHFPGNLRELERIFEHFYILSENKYISFKQLPDYLFQHNQQLDSSFFDSNSFKVVPLDTLIKEYCRKVCMLNNNNKAKTARELGISLNTLKKYLS